MNEKIALIGAAGVMVAGGAYLAFHREPTLAEQVVDTVGAPFRAASTTFAILPWVLGGAVIVAAIVAVQNPGLVLGTIGRK